MSMTVDQIKALRAIGNIVIEAVSVADPHTSALLAATSTQP